MQSRQRRKARHQLYLQSMEPTETRLFRETLSREVQDAHIALQRRVADLELLLDLKNRIINRLVEEMNGDA